MRDKRRAEERIAAMKHHQPKPLIVINKDINRQVIFTKIMLNVCLLLTKTVNKARTQIESSQHSMFEDRQARAKSGVASDCVDMTSKC